MVATPRIAGSVESYAHKAAKATLVQWFRDAAKGRYDKYVQACGLSWRVNRGAPHWGVWEEYPIDGSGASLECPVWDESWWWTDLEAKRCHGQVDYGLALRNAGSSTMAGFRKSGSFLDMETYGEEPEDPEPDNPIPSYDELVELGIPPRAIVDVAIQHKGTIKYGFEIVHKHGLTPEKRAFLESIAGYCTTFYVIPAKWVLCQVCTPTRLCVTEVIGDCGSVRVHGLRVA